MIEAGFLFPAPPVPAVAALLSAHQLHFPIPHRVHPACWQRFIRLSRLVASNFVVFALAKPPQLILSPGITPSTLSNYAPVVALVSFIPRHCMIFDGYHAVKRKNQIIACG